MAYLLDTDVFIRAKNLHYGLDFCPAFWEWVVVENTAERLFSIEKVGDELQGIEDELSIWAATHGGGLFLRPDSAAFPALATVSAWAVGHGHVEARGRRGKLDNLRPRPYLLDLIHLDIHGRRS